MEKGKYCSSYSSIILSPLSFQYVLVQWGEIILDFFFSLQFIHNDRAVGIVSSSIPSTPKKERKKESLLAFPFYLSPQVKKKERKSWLL